MVVRYTLMVRTDSSLRIAIMPSMRTCLYALRYPESALERPRISRLRRPDIMDRPGSIGGNVLNLSAKYPQRRTLLVEESFS